jgi:electron transfer flavoprotein alpha/beta subunit
MKILVGIKRVIDYNVRVQVNRDGTGVVKDGVKMSINPFDEIAVEEALRIKERGDAAEVIVVSIGPEPAQQQLRTALAMGADRAILYQADEEVQPLAAARALLKVVQAEDPGLVLLGKQAIDDDCQPGRADAGGAVGPAAGDLRLRAGIQRGRCWSPPARWTPGWRRSRSSCRPWSPST